MAEEQSVETILVPVDLRDIILAVQIIDLSAERGGFKGPELEIIGQARGRLANLIQENRPEEPEAVEETAA